MSRSIGYTNSISGSFPRFYPIGGDYKGRALGGAYQGYMAQQLQTTEKGSYGSNVFENIRFTLRHAWNTLYKEQLRTGVARQPNTIGQLSYGKRQIITPFRAVNNAGDLLCRDSYSCGGPCQTFQSRPQLRGLRQHFGNVSRSCIPSNIYNAYQLNASVPAAACNGRFVYDSSDYTTYLKQRAMVSNYNDITFGGNANNGSQSAYRAIRRY
jgi:hypothetical protein